MSVALGKHYVGYQLKRGRMSEDYIERQNNEGHQPDWDGICQAAMDKQEWRVWTAQCASHWKD